MPGGGGGGRSLPASVEAPCPPGAPKGGRGGTGGRPGMAARPCPAGAPGAAGRTCGLFAEGCCGGDGIVLPPAPGRRGARGAGRTTGFFGAPPADRGPAGAAGFPAPMPPVSRSLEDGGTGPSPPGAEIPPSRFFSEAEIPSFSRQLPPFPEAVDLLLVPFVMSARFCPNHISSAGRTPSRCRPLARQ